MQSRRIITALTCIFYPLQFALVMYWFSSSPQKASLVGVPEGLVVNLVFAAVNVGIVRYILRSLDTSRTSYLQSVNDLTERYLEAYRRESEQEGRHIQEVIREIDEELSRAADALTAGDHDEMDRRLRMGLALASNTHVPTCEHAAVAAVLESKRRQCEQAHVTLSARVILTEQLPLDDLEVASLFFNLIDNALHECEALIAKDPEAQPCVDVHARIQAGQLFVQVSNPCRPASLERHQEAVRHTKARDLHGWGTGIARDLAARHGGLSKFEEWEGTFTASVMIPLSRDGQKSPTSGAGAKPLDARR